MVSCHDHTLLLNPFYFHKELNILLKMLENILKPHHLCLALANCVVVTSNYSPCSLWYWRGRGSRELGRKWKVLRDKQRFFLFNYARSRETSKLIAFNISEKEGILTEHLQDRLLTSAVCCSTWTNCTTYNCFEARSLPILFYGIPSDGLGLTSPSPWQMSKLFWVVMLLWLLQ